MADIYFDDNVSVDKVNDDTWRAYSSALGIAVYGDTRDAADAKLADAARLLFDVMNARGGLARALKRLDAGGIPHRVVESEDDMVRLVETRVVAAG
jgi:hypothetical protein